MITSTTVTSVIQVITIVILAGTLYLTGQLARATQQQAMASSEQLRLFATVGSRPLLSIQQLRLSWNANRLVSLRFAVSNAGQGACFNVVIAITGISKSWSIRTDEAEVDGTAYGALRTGELRRFIASSGEHMVEDRFDNELNICVECFDALLGHYTFSQRFIVAPGLEYVKESGLAVNISSDKPPAQGKGR
jgi:hypothetical protein